MNISKHVIVKKNPCKEYFLKCEMDFLKAKNLQQSHHLKLLKIKNILGKFQCSSLRNFSFDDVLFFILTLL